MPITCDVLSKYVNPVLIETGSFQGDGVQRALEAGFKKVYTIEISEKYHKITSDRFKGNLNVVCVKGDSTEVLPDLLKSINQPVTFWLDAHCSGSDTGIGKKYCPLLDELNIIKKHRSDNTVLIDDLRLWKDEDKRIGFGFKEIEQTLKEINPNYHLSYEDGYVPNDILVAKECTKNIATDLNVLIFSKDRACQCDALLRSMEKHYKDVGKYSPTILYSASNPLFDQGYERLKKKHPCFNFVKQTQFRNQTLSIPDPSKKYIQFFVDDIIFIRPFDPSSAMNVMEVNPQLFTYSIRLGSDINYSLLTDTKYDTIPNPGVFDMTLNYYKGDWAYPFSLDGNIYKMEDIWFQMARMHFSNPNTLEANVHNDLKNNRSTFCYFNKYPCMVNLSLNRVQNDFKNKCGAKHTPESLNKEFLDGKGINLGPFQNRKYNSVHLIQEIVLC